MNISKTFWTITALVVGSILITGCSNGSNAMGDELEGLQEALSMTPDRADLNAFIFSNWLNGQPENSEPIINSNSSLGDRWMWGIADLDWEVEMNFAGGGAPVRLFKLNNEFDFAPVMAVYEERGFGREELGGAILYTHEQDMSSNPPIISHANTLFLPERKMMLITSGGGVPDLPSLFEFYSEPEGKVSKAEFPSMAGLIQELENELQVFVIWDNCETLKIDALIEFIDKNTEIELSDQEMTFLRDVQRDINTYDPLGVGYHYEDALTVGKIVFGYDSAETATSDLPFRERLAARSSFSLDDIKSDGPNLILDVTNTNPAPTSFDWWPGSYRSTNYGLFLCP